MEGGRVLSLARMDTLLANDLKTTGNACHLDVKRRRCVGSDGHGAGALRQVHLEALALSLAEASESLQRRQARGNFVDTGARPDSLATGPGRCALLTGSSGNNLTRPAPREDVSLLVLVLFLMLSSTSASPCH